ncbi:MAG: hypothetical protein M3Y87_35580, partial [Myxococcota bacterium]|nr:hypothetical protein [Myxococcota bacterium]
MAQASERRAQVVMSWGGTPQGIVAVKAGGRVVIGEGRTTFLLPAELVPEAFTLLESTDEGGFVLRVPAGATLRAERDGAAIDAGDGEG